MALERVKSNKGSVEPKKFVPKSKRSEMSQQNETITDNSEKAIFNYEKMKKKVSI